jgi:anti-sigma28 factor (negative regulator of flagellin synthesis)
MPVRKRSVKQKSLQIPGGFRREAILRSQRIERLRVRIESGEYKVSAVQIAAAMLRDRRGWDLSAS